MATKNETRLSVLAKIATLAGTTTSLQELATLAEGSSLLTQANLSGELITAQNTAKQAIYDKAKELADGATSAEDLGYLAKAMDSFLVETISTDGTFIPYDLTQPYGGIHNVAQDKWYDLGHGVPIVQESMRRVVCTGNPMFGGSTYRYLNSDNSSQWEDGSDATAYVAGGAINGSQSTYQVYVETPKFYYVQKKIGELYYFAVGVVPFTIKSQDGTLLTSSTHSMFRKAGWTDSGDGTDTANEYAYNYVGAFESILWDNDASLTIAEGNIQTNGVTVDYANDKLISVANLSLHLKPASYLTRANARALHINATSKQWHWNTYSGLRLLYLTEYKNHNAQATIGGYTEGGSFSYGKVAPTGTTLSLGNKSGAILNNASVIPTIAGVSTSAVIGMSYRGIENIFGNIWKWCDGVNFSNWIPYTCDLDDTYTDNLFTAPYTQAGSKQPTTNAYQSKIQDGNFFVETVGSSSLKDITDYYYQSSGSRVLRLGGSLSYGAYAGLSCLICYDSSSGVSAFIGSR